MEGSDYIKKIRLLLLGMFFLITMSISGIYALTNQENAGAINTGIADIKIQTFKIDNNNNEVEYLDESQEVMPGEVISIIPKVYNSGADCYTRIKVEYVDENTDFMDYVTGFSDKLKKYGEYYYYDDILHEKESLKIFDTIKIPTYFKQEEQQQVVLLRITAEAIQKKNFEPDYSLENPWKDIKPTQGIQESYELDNKNSKIVIKYENNVNKDITVPKKFFHNIMMIMPGDSSTENIEIKNNNNRKTRYYLELGNEENRVKEIELLNKIRLIITNKSGMVLYNGSLINKGKILLGEFEPGGTDSLQFTISVPSDLSNEYALLNPQISFIFSEEDMSKNPQTGDTIDWAITIFFISSIGLIVVMILGYRENTKEEC